MNGSHFMSILLGASLTLTSAAAWNHDSAGVGVCVIMSIFFFFVVKCLIKEGI